MPPLRANRAVISSDPVQSEVGKPPVPLDIFIRPVTLEDYPTIWSIIGPVIREGATYTIDRDLSEADALAYWNGSDKETFVAVVDGSILGTHYLRANFAGGGAHVSNCGYITAPGAAGRGLARRMCQHSMEHARNRGFRAMQFNFVVSSNDRAIALWQSLGFAIVGGLPGAFDHPRHGEIDALIMFRKL